MKTVSQLALKGILCAMLSLSGVFGAGIDVCQPKNEADRPYLGTNPTLVFSFDEADTGDLNEASNRASLKYYKIVSINGIHGIDYNVQMIPKGMFDPNEYFMFDVHNGESYLRLTSPVDRDGPTASIEDDMSFIPFFLRCQPTDGTLAEVVYDAEILINDVNDNKPEFTHPQDSDVYISENAAVGATVFTVQAQDKDLNLDGNLTFSFITGNSPFTIDPITGVVVLASQLDFETMGIQKTIDVVVNVEDAGPDFHQTSSTTIRVHVTDADDQNPVFVYDGCLSQWGKCYYPMYISSVTLSEDTAISVRPFPSSSSRTVDIRARDADTTINNVIVFSIASTNPEGHESSFRVETSKNAANEYVAQIISLVDNVLDDGFEIYLKAEEQSSEKRSDTARILFTSATSTTSETSGALENKAAIDDDDDYSDQELALIVVTAVLAALLVCACIALVCLLVRNKRHSKGADLQMGQVNNGYSS